jgi:DNA ligase 1
MLLTDVVQVSGAMAATSKRSEKTALVADLLRTAAVVEVPIIVGLADGRVPQVRNAP